MTRQLFTLFALSAALALPAAAKELPTTWREIDGAFALDGQDVTVYVDRSAGTAAVWEHRAGPEADAPPHTIRNAPFKLSSGVLKRLVGATSKAKALAWPDLKRGASGKPVARVQRALNERGAKLRVDARFGPATERAVRRFQVLHGLIVTGEVGREERDLLGLHPAVGRITVDDVETASTEVAGVLRLIAKTFLEGAEPEEKTLTGKVVEFDHGLQLYGTAKDGSKQRYRLEGWHPKLDQALSLLGSVTVKAFVWPAKAGQAAAALVREVRVRATAKSLPKGVKAGETVTVVGLRKVPARTIKTSAGKRLVGGTVVKVRGPKGEEGHLENPTESAKPQASKTGAATAIQGATGRQGATGPR